MKKQQKVINLTRLIFSGYIKLLKDNFNEKNV